MAARASLFRTESRWGLYHHCVDHPQRDDENWFCHTALRRGADGSMQLRKLAVEPYVVAVDESEKAAYHRLRVARVAETV
jgi:succinate dehydrogenase/fumarate reductase flavoprotein subunit